jgi:hypothetical protein
VIVGLRGHSAEQDRVLSHASRDPAVRSLISVVLNASVAGAKDELVAVNLSTNSHRAAELQGYIRGVEELISAINSAQPEGRAVRPMPPMA